MQMTWGSSSTCKPGLHPPQVGGKAVATELNKLVPPHPTLMSQAMWAA